MGFRDYLKNGNELNEGTKKPHFGSAEKFNYAYSVDGVQDGFETQIFGRQLDSLRKVREFTNNAKKYDVNAKGINTMTAVKNWVKEFKPKEFYARWQKDSSNYKDDSVEVYYTR
jgi:hypothetical protein